MWHGVKKLPLEAWSLGLSTLNISVTPPYNLERPHVLFSSDTKTEFEVVIDPKFRA